MRRLAVLAACGLVATPALASSPAAWASERRAARAACVAASGLIAPAVTLPAGFDDRRPLDGLLLTGRTRAGRGVGPRVTMLCLYDRRTRRAQTIEAAGWPAVR